MFYTPLQHVFSSLNSNNRHGTLGSSTCIHRIVPLCWKEDEGVAHHFTFLCNVPVVKSSKISRNLFVLFMNEVKTFGSTIWDVFARDLGTQTHMCTLGIEHRFGASNMISMHWRWCNVYKPWCLKDWSLLDGVPVSQQRRQDWWNEFQRGVWTFLRWWPSGVWLHLSEYTASISLCWTLILLWRSLSKKWCCWWKVSTVFVLYVVCMCFPGRHPYPYPG